MLSKNELRKKAKELRKHLNIEAISRSIVENIQELELYKKAKNILIFYPLKEEINLLALTKDKKNFYLPKIEGEDLLICPYKAGDELIESSFKTLEPKTKPISPSELDIIFIPALIVSKDYHRLGYGKGYYDRFLTKNAIQALRIVPIANTFILEELPFDEFDVQIDAIIDET